MSGAEGDDLVKVRASLDALVRGMTLIVDTQNEHTKMLKLLMLAAAPDDGASPLREALERIAAAIERIDERMGVSDE